jgi:hypothetical protein
MNKHLRAGLIGIALGALLVLIVLTWHDQTCEICNPEPEPTEFCDPYQGDSNDKYTDRSGWVKT